MEDADTLVPALAANFDKALGGSLEPGRHHACLRMPDGAEALPVSRVAPQDPVFDNLANARALDQCRFHLRRAPEFVVLQVGGEDILAIGVHWRLLHADSTRTIIVFPAKAGIQSTKTLDSRFRGNDKIDGQSRLALKFPRPLARLCCRLRL